jgi:response regulator NasT
MKVMLVDENRGRAALLKQALSDAGFEVVATINQGSRLLLELQKIAVDVILIDMASPDRDILEHLAIIRREQPKPVIMLADDDDSRIIQAAVSAGVSAYVVDGFNHKRLNAIMQVAVARFREYQAMRDELEDTKHKLAERKLVDKAKGLLMRHKNMSEEEAYQALRKLAMNKNKKIVEIAEQLINAAELLSVGSKTG